MKRKIKLFEPSVGKDEECAIKHVLKSGVWASGAGGGKVIEFEKKYPEGTLFRPTKDEITSWRLFAKQELGLSDYLYDLIYNDFRL